MTSMKDLYTKEQIVEALEETKEARDKFIIELRRVDNYIFFLEYYIKTGEYLDINALDLPLEVYDD